MLQRLKNAVHKIQAQTACALYGNPSRQLKIIAITGTDGKTTTSSLVYHILKTAGCKVALISTVAAFIGDEEIDTGFHVTTPSPFALQKLLRKVVNSGMEYVVLEVTSHGIDQNRVYGIEPMYAGITNVTHEHLDYHKTFDAYVATKAKILQRSSFAFINKDAKTSVEKLQHILEESKTSYHVYSKVSIPRKIRDAVHKRFETQEYNVQNAALALSIARKIGIKEKDMQKAIISFPGVIGRMQHMPNKRGVRVIVDFAHTPHALEEVLTAVTQRQVKKGKCIVVFGCAGLRDVSKRPMMGEIASKLVDQVVLTAEDPRTEDVWSIIAQIKSGVKSGHQKLLSIPDRFSAIEFALNTLANKGDTVIITGKGHEKSMCFGKTEYPWSDQKAVEMILAKKN